MAAWWLHTIRTLESLIVAIKFVFEVKERERERGRLRVSVMILNGNSDRGKVSPGKPAASCVCHM